MIKQRATKHLRKYQRAGKTSKNITKSWKNILENNKLVRN